VSNIKKKMIAQNVEPGNVAMAIGYATNTNPGPVIETA